MVPDCPPAAISIRSAPIVSSMPCGGIVYVIAPCSTIVAEPSGRDWLETIVNRWSYAMSAASRVTPPVSAIVPGACVQRANGVGRST